MISLISLVLGMIAVALGLSLWRDLHPDHARSDAFERAITLIRWCVSLILLVTTALLWFAGPEQHTREITLVVITAIAALPTHTHRSLMEWEGTITAVPPLALAAYGLIVALRPAGTTSIPVNAWPIPTVLIAGVATRVLGLSVGAFFNTDIEFAGSYHAAYLAMTTLLGGGALVNLWREGTLWTSSSCERGLTGAWLVWTAAWLIPEDRRLLRAGAISLGGAVTLLVALTCI